LHGRFNQSEEYNLRFNRRNWVRFFDGHHKSTTIRLKPQRIGTHNAWAGSYNHPELLGTFVVYDVTSKLFKHLDFWDSINDGFRELHELKEELKHLNPGITDETMVYINWIENAKESKQ
jgi:hypothetical protein